MKVLVYYQTSNRKDIYEAMRLRKNLKGACELAGITHVKSALDQYDLVHFISSNDESAINDAIENHKPVCISALMCESDPTAKMIVSTSKGDYLSSKALRVLNKVDMVFVSSMQAMSFLKSQGVTSDIRFLPSGVNLSRFQPVSETEKEIFYRYFSANKADKIVVSVAEYDTQDEVDKFIEIAKRCPDVKFYFIGQSKRPTSLSRKIKKIMRRTPTNVNLNPILDDDVYRSLMMNSDIYLSLSPLKADSVTILDAMAAKAQIIAFKSDQTSDSFLTSDVAYFGKNIDEVANIIKLYLANGLTPTADKAYDIAKEFSLYEIGKKLKLYYSELFEKTEERKHD
ncbi:MAG: glycosyltransferase [Bacilli bacterium]|jgi:glycosyltransferase involved in cell wall biosynthesis